MQLRNMSRVLTDEEIAACEGAQQFANVTPVMLFGAKSDGGLAQKVMRENPVRYRQLRDEWLIESGIVPRPDSYYG